MHAAAPLNAAPTSAAPIEVAKRALLMEAEALRVLAQGLGASFLTATRLLLGIQGRVIVSGMGKSGHIGRKIAATFASTGTPAFFVHPGEASHGDLGMIAAGDAVLALSNSGETSELSDLMAHTARAGLPLLAMTGNAQSPLARAASVALILPPEPEACPLGLAPTTSTTMMLALGDALALALLNERGFTEAHYRALHPGGKLGKKLLTVRDLMHEGAALPLVSKDMLMQEAILVMSAKSFGCAGVVDAAGKLLGIVTDGDLRRHMGADLLSLAVAAVMTAAPKTIAPQALAAEALGRMNRDKITSLFVEEDGFAVGLIHLHDCLRAGVA